MTDTAPTATNPSASLQETIKELQTLAEEIDTSASGTPSSGTPAFTGASSGSGGEDPVAASVQVGYYKSGRPFLQVQGASSLLEIRGLLWYAEKEIERILGNRLQTPDAQLTALQTSVDQLAQSLKDLPDALKALTKALRKAKA